MRQTEVLAKDGTKIARVSIGYVVRGVQLGGLRLDAAPASTPAAVGGAFLTSVLERAASLALPLDEESEREVADWLGIQY